MIRLAPYALAAVLAAGGVGYVWHLSSALTAEKAATARLERENAALARSYEQALEARRVADAAAERIERDRQQLAADLAALTKGIADAPLDPDLAARLNRRLQ